MFLSAGKYMCAYAVADDALLQNVSSRAGNDFVNGP